MTTTTYHVTGMTCGHCVNAVSGALTKLEGVSDVSIELDTGAVSVTSDAALDDVEVREAIEEAGYELA